LAKKRKEEKKKRLWVSYHETYNPILEYWVAIQKGEESVGDKIRRQYKKLVDDINTPNDEWHYDPQRGNHILEFAENFCKLIQGAGGGEYVRLELWEKAMLAAAFGFVDSSGLRKYQQVILIIGKKNGKSLIASIVGLYMLLADGEAGPEIYAVATKRDQAKKVWMVAKQMVQASPSLRKRAKPLVADINSDDFNYGSFKPLGSNVDTLDGLNVHCALMDELQQWKNGRALFEMISYGITARLQPMIFITTTAGMIRDDIYDEKYEEAKKVILGYDDPDGYRDDRLLPLIYELDKREEWTDPSCWKKANPGLGTIKNEKTLREMVERAKKNPALVKYLLCKEFNVGDTAQGAWLTKEQVINDEKFDLDELKPRYGIGGADLSGTTDLTAAKVIFKVPDDKRFYVLSMYWIPEDLVEKRVKEDKVPYDLWIEQGYVRTCQGKKIDYHMVTDWFCEVQRDMDIYLPWIGYDAWSAGYWADEMKDHFGAEAMVAVPQTMKVLSRPMQELHAEFEDRLIIYNNNPVDKWCFHNTQFIEDKNGNIKPVKSRMAMKRIDGLAALLDAYVVYCDRQAEYEALI